MASRDAPRELWRPDSELRANCRLSQYRDWLRLRGEDDGPLANAPITDYEALWAWSVSDVPRFWSGLIEFFDVQYDGNVMPALTAENVADARWFARMSLNYAEHVFRRREDARAMFVTVREDGAPVEHTWFDVAAKVADLQAVLAKAGVRRGSRVAGFLPNTEHAVIAFLATAGLGAVWSCCSPDFGKDAVLDRFSQIEPTVLIACAGYRYGGKYRDRTDVVQQLAAALPSLSLKLVVDEVDVCETGVWTGWTAWDRLPVTSAAPRFERVPFGHPLWILYSSGTTGAPKAIVHGHGGCLLEHLKYLSLQADVRPGERFFWFTTTGWMMWNFLQASMLVGGVPVFYDGSPGYPGLDRLWRLVAELPIHHFGTSAPFLHACMRAGLHVADEHDLSTLRSIGSTGAPLSPEGFAYVYAHVKSDIWLTSMSGGTDVCTAFVGGSPWTPVYEGWIQGRALGCDLHAYDEANQPVLGEEGELVVRQPMPSMPVKFWNDLGNARRRESYFADIPGVWRHGDWITVAKSGQVKIHGRSDATLNRQGVRIGTAELYRYVTQHPEVEDALVVNYVTSNGTDHMPLFVVLREGFTLEGFRQNLLNGIRTTLSPRHVPTRVEVVPDIPYTISGKRLETPVKRLFEGRAPETVAKRGSLRNPAALDHFAHLAALPSDRDGAGAVA